MTEKTKGKERKHNTLITENSLKFFENYINNPSPTGFEWEGQRMWLDYLKPYVDQTYVDNYGTAVGIIDRKSTRLNSSHVSISYAVFCLKKKINTSVRTRSSCMLDDPLQLKAPSI